MKKSCVVLVSVALLGACGPAENTGTTFSSRSGEWQAAMNSGDADAIAALYAEDARVMPPNMPATIGRSAVREAFGAMIDAGMSVELRSIATESSGDLAYNVGTYRQRVNDEVTDEGKFIEVWRRGPDGDWLMINDIWNSDRPMQMSRDDRPHVMAFHEVEDIDRWVNAWRGENSRHDLFAAHGVAHTHMFQSESNPNLTGLVMSIDDMQAFNAFMASEEAAQAAEEDGVDLAETTLMVEIE